MPNPGKTVIILEDDTDISDLLAQLISSCDAVPVICRNSEAVMNAVDKHDIALALLDIMLPDTDGREVLRQLKDRNIQFPVYLMTGINTSSIGEEYCKLAHGILKKPFSIEQLRTLLASTLMQEQKDYGSIFHRRILELMATVATEQENVRRQQTRLMGLIRSSSNESTALAEQFKEFSMTLEASLARFASRLEEMRDLLDKAEA